MATLKQMAEKKNAQEPDDSRPAERADQKRRRTPQCIIDVDAMTCPFEKREDLEDIIADHYERYAPVDVVERNFVDMLIMDEWRLRRYAVIEEQLIALMRKEPERYNEKTLKGARRIINSIKKMQKDTLRHFAQYRKDPPPPGRRQPTQQPAAPQVTDPPVERQPKEPLSAEAQPLVEPYQLHWIN